MDEDLEILNRRIVHGFVDKLDTIDMSIVWLILNDKKSYDFAKILISNQNALRRQQLQPQRSITSVGGV